MAFLKKYIPGFANARIKTIASATGIRESRRIVGVETLDTDMIFNSEQNDNSVAVCAYPIISTILWVRISIGSGRERAATMFLMV